MVSIQFGAVGLAIRTAVVLFGTYFAWLVTFERWIEPTLRRWAGSIARRTIVWVAAGRGLRIWGVEHSRGPADAAVPFAGALLVFASALLPAVLLAKIAASEGADTRISASSYLISVPLMALFVLRMLAVRHDDGV